MNRHPKDNPDHVLAARRDDLVALFERAPIKHSFGMASWYDEEGHAIFDLPYNPGLDHALKGVHGGVIATLLDNAGWFTAAPHYDTWIATIEMSMRLHEHVSAEALQSRGRIVRLGHRVSVCAMEVRTAAGRLIATGQGTFTVTGVAR
jgi:uncharacterized protein (TIGR00369 family)